MVKERDRGYGDGKYLRGGRADTWEDTAAGKEMLCARGDTSEGSRLCVTHTGARTALQPVDRRKQVRREEQLKETLMCRPTSQHCPSPYQRSWDGLVETREAEVQEVSGLS